MLADEIVNVIRRRNMSEDVQRKAAKWQRAIRTVEWLLAQLPPESRYQVYTFNTEAIPAAKGTEGAWQDAADSVAMDSAVNALRERVPQGGTSLINAFAVTGQFSQGPDNIFLITDGLPTQGKTRPRGNTVTQRERLELFDRATRTLPKVPVNTILFPMEGDPLAAAQFWQLGIASKGSFLSPASDWP